MGHFQRVPGAKDLTMREPGLFRLATFWLLLLALIFFSTYGFATWFTSQRNDVGTLVFAWETHVPFLAWTIVPYWSIDLLYGLSLFLPDNRAELKRHVLRLLSAQLIAVTCFLIWPLRFTFERPELDGVFGWLFAVLAGFDKPFNQAPSLHIALLVIVWVMFQRHTQGLLRWWMHGWFGLIGISVLTTYQHHFIDVPTGALLGWLCVWMWPLQQFSPLSSARLAQDSTRWQLALRYGAGVLGLLILAFKLGGWWLWMLWPAASFLLVALNYGLLGAAGFQKGIDGQLTQASRWLYAPYLGAAWVNSRLWTHDHPRPDLIVDNVWLGRIPAANELQPFNVVVDLCAELPVKPQDRVYYSLPVLDLTVPTLSQCLEAGQAIERLRHHGPLLVCCALGYSRSATAVAAWLLISRRAETLDQAVAIIGTARPCVVLHAAHRSVLKALVHAR